MSKLWKCRTVKDHDCNAGHPSLQTAHGHSHHHGTFSCASLQEDPRPSPLAFFPLLSLARRVWRPLLPLSEVWGLGQGNGQGAQLGWAHPAGQSTWPPRPPCSVGTCHPHGAQLPTFWNLLPSESALPSALWMALNPATQWRTWLSLMEGEQDPLLGLPQPP